jgi:hypothetical protein
MQRFRGTNQYWSSSREHGVQTEVIRQGTSEVSIQTTLEFEAWGLFR